MIDIPLGWADLAVGTLIYAAIGIAIVIAEDPLRYLDFVTRAYLRRHGRLPGRLFVAGMFVLAVAAWPKTYAVLAAAGRARR